jgi:ArsR family transcriptional regulator, arsenate/arsenite/antimonite-responsive transcriptional repressor / arsenate reductase (thioredoxin)
VNTSELERRARLHAALGEPVRLAIVDRLALADASPGDQGVAVGVASNLLAHHLGVLQEAGVIRRVRSEGDRRRSYVQLRLDDPAVTALAGAGQRTKGSPGSDLAAGDVRRVLFVCTHNSARSQLAAALWRRLTRTASAASAASAGTHPAPAVHPLAVQVGRRHGLRLGNARTSALEQVRQPEDLVVAVCDNAHEELTAPADAARLHWSVPDTVRVGTEAAFEAAYQDLHRRVARLAAALAA